MALTQQETALLDLKDKLDDEAQLAIEAATSGVVNEFARRGFRHPLIDMDHLRAAVVRYFVRAQGPKS